MKDSSFDVINPATGERIQTVEATSKKQIDSVLTSAIDAQRKWAAVPVWKRGKALEQFIKRINNESESLAYLLSSETGKLLRDARGEILGLPYIIESYIEKAKHITGDVVSPNQLPGQERHLCFTQREPLGVVVCIVPFNYPADLFVNKVIPALLCGNVVIVKPSSEAPLTVMRLTDILKQVMDLPGIIDVVVGSGQTVGEALTTDNRVNGISFTGSTKAGRSVSRNAAMHFARCTLELGGNDVYIVWADADIDLAVREVVRGRLYNAGQVCCGSKRFLIHEKIYDDFIERLTKKIQSIKVGDPMKDGTDMGCLISENAAVTVEQQISQIISEGGRLTLGGERQGAFIEPTIIVDVPADASVMRDQEIFGPVIPIAKVGSEEEAINISNQSVYGLNGCIFTADMKRALRFAKDLSCGTVVINGAGNFRVTEMPFGGRGQSGMGREGVLSSFDEMTICKTIVLKNII